MMKKLYTRLLWMAAVFFLLFIVQPTGVQAASGDTAQTWQVGVDDLSVYPAPDSHLPAVGTLNKSEICLVTETMTDNDGVLWGRLEDEQSGWIRLDRCLNLADMTACGDGPAADTIYGALRIAHRGSHTNGEEDNTVESFTQAGKEGFWGIETDLRANYDTQTLVVHHDSAADATCTFSEYLDICKKYGCVAVIDMKYMSQWKTYVPKAVEMVQEKGMTDQVIFQCSIGEYLDKVRELCEDAKVWFLAPVDTSTDTYKTVTYGGKSMTLEAAVAAINPDGVNLDISVAATSSLVTKFHAAGYEICTNLYGKVNNFEKFKDLYSDYRMSNIPNP